MAESTLSEQVIRQAPYLEDIQKKILEAAVARGETPVEIPAIQAAPLDPLTQQAVTTGQGIGQFMPYLSQGAGTINEGLASLQANTAGVPGLFTQAQQQALGSMGSYDPSSALSFMDPYQQAVTQEALAEMQRQADIQQNTLSAQAVNIGAFGGSRQGVAQAEMGRNLSDMQSRRIFEDLSRNYNQAQAASQTAFSNQQQRQGNVAALLGNLGGAQAQSALGVSGGIGAFGTQQANLAGQGQQLLGQQTQLLSQLGATQQTQAQRELDAARQTQLQQVYEPFQRIGFMSDIFKPNIGSASSSLGVQVAPSPSPLSQAIGTGIAAFGINKGMDNAFTKAISGMVP
tara:strand:+ start:486 stop:1517 length:1032 start_codon:yes stop_codon:yes gene_type:complete